MDVKHHKLPTALNLIKVTDLEIWLPFKKAISHEYLEYVNTWPGVNIQCDQDHGLSPLDGACDLESSA